VTEPRAIELVDFVLLACQFNVHSPGEDEHAATAASEGDNSPTDDEAAAAGIEVDGARLNILAIEVDEDENEFVFVLETTVTEVAAPYRLGIVTGSRFTVPEPPVSANEAASTLLFISYPYVRELVFSITSRSPFTGFRLPPFTRRPSWDPSRSLE
jgi:hypothetical protein